MEKILEQNPFARAGQAADTKAERILSKGRKPLQAAEPAEVVVDEPRFGGAMAAMREEGQALVTADQQHRAHVLAVAAQVGYQLPVDSADPDLIQRDIAANMRRSVEACLEVGRGLSVLKVACEHGNFIARLDVLGLDRKVAAKFMQSAAKFSNVSTSRHLTAALGNQSKLFEMLVLDDEQIEELELTGQTGELKLDDVATMSVKELRKAVRELKGEVAAKEELLTTRAKQINTLEEKVSRIKTVPLDEVLGELQTKSLAHFNDTRGALVGKFSAAVDSLVEHAQAGGGEPDMAFLAGLLGQLQADLAALRDRHGIPDIAPALIPDWVRDPAFADFEG